MLVVTQVSLVHFPHLISNSGVDFMPENGIYRSPMDKPEPPKMPDFSRVFADIERQEREAYKRKTDAENATISTAEQLAQVKRQLDQQAIDSAKLAKENRRLQWIVIAITLVGALFTAISVLLQIAG